ncbi:MAG: hypothetical protein LBV67_10855, partial [Streptococcaceae bacterium]|nr:hypothetical protein [Streptococcaceae bacterium]
SACNWLSNLTEAEYVSSQLGTGFPNVTEATDFDEPKDPLLDKEELPYEQRILGHWHSDSGRHFITFYEDGTGSTSLGWVSNNFEWTMVDDIIFSPNNSVATPIPYYIIYSGDNLSISRVDGRVRVRNLTRTSEIKNSMTDYRSYQDLIIGEWIEVYDGDEFHYAFNPDGTGFFGLSEIKWWFEGETFYTQTIFQPHRMRFSFEEDTLFLNGFSTRLHNRRPVDHETRPIAFSAGAAPAIPPVITEPPTTSNILTYDLLLGDISVIGLPDEDYQIRLGFINILMGLFDEVTNNSELSDTERTSNLNEIRFHANELARDLDITLTGDLNLRLRQLSSELVRRAR